MTKIRGTLSGWSFNALALGLIALAWAAEKMPKTYPAQHRAVGRATRKDDRDTRAYRDRVAALHLTFVRFDQDQIGVGVMDAFTTPPLPQRRFRALTPRALAAAAINLRHAMRDKVN